MLIHIEFLKQFLIHHHKFYYDILNYIMIYYKNIYENYHIDSLLIHIHYKKK